MIRLSSSIALRKTAKDPALPVLMTPDARYIVVRGRLWRAANPALEQDARVLLVAELMAARREVSRAARALDDSAIAAARIRVGRAKEGLGERGPVWWNDGAPDLNRKLAKNTIYAEWWRQASQHGPAAKAAGPDSESLEETPAVGMKSGHGGG